MDIDNNVSKKDEIIEENDKYFKSKVHRIVFALVELETESRAQILNITNELYHDKKKAKKWRDNLSKMIHPDICKIDGAVEAMSVLNELYEGMIEDE